MRKPLLVLALALFLLVGCKKFSKSTKGTPPGTTSGTPGSTVVNPGSGGVVQGVRMAAVRTVNYNEMKNLHLFMEAGSAASGQLPDSRTVLAEIQREAPKTYKHLDDKSIVLTGARSRDSIWAYTADPQNAIGNHLVITSSGVEQMAGETMKQRLEQQKGR